MASCKARVRSQVYALLAAALASPEPMDFDEQAAPLTGCPDWLVQGLRQVNAGRTEDDQTLHTRLFVGPARPLVYPYESCYRDPEGWLGGPWAGEVAEIYARAGLAPNELQPDHIVAELAFMAHLADREAHFEDAQDETAAASARAEQAAFLREHLLAWGPAFCQRLRDATDEPGYRALAEILARWLEAEAAHFGLEKRRASGSFPATVIGRLCTLCGVCAEACPTGALSLLWTEGEAQLNLRARACTGCGVCVDVCPFGAVRTGVAPATGILVRSPLLACPRCGQPALPEAFWRKLSRRFEGDEPAMQRAKLCPTCRQGLVAQGLPHDLRRKHHAASEPT